MPGRESVRLVGMKKKKKRTKKQKMYLMTLKKCWLVEDRLVPLYQHLMDVYSDKLNRESNVTLGECDLQEMLEVKQEPQDDDFMKSPYAQESKPTMDQVLDLYKSFIVSIWNPFVCILSTSNFSLKILANYFFTSGILSLG